MARLCFAAALALCLAIWFIAQMWRDSEKLTLDRAAIDAYGGVAVTVRLPDPPKWQTTRSDAAPPLNQSRLVLLEDGVPLPAPHSIHAEIAEKGGGRYSHWGTVGKDGDWVIFSASDSSDPRTNAKTYEVIRELSLTPLLKALIVAAAAAALAAVFYVLRATLLPDLRKFRAWLREGPEHSPLRSFLLSLLPGGLARPLPRWSATLGAVAGGAALAVYYLQYVDGAETLGNAVAGSFQIRDASGYWHCANQLVDDGAGNFWCHRRPIYSMFLSGLSVLSGRGLEQALVLQAAFLGACIFLFLRQLSHWIGWIAAGLAAFPIVNYAKDFALGQTMTENLGLGAGLLAGAMLLKAGEDNSFRWALVGTATFTMAELTRAGAVFALPLLVLWAASFRPHSFRGLVLAAAAAATVVAAAIAINAGFVAHLGGDPRASNANFAQTFYGLTLDRNWTAVQEDHPELIPETRENINEIYRLSLANVQSDPSALARSLGRNFELYLNTPWFSQYTGNAPFVFFISLLLVAVAAWKDQRARMVLAVALGEIVAAPILTGDGVVRVWAASGALTQAAMPAFALGVAFSVCIQIIGLRPKPAISRMPSLWQEPSFALAAVTAFLVLVPLTPIRLLAADVSASSSPACPIGLRRVQINLAAANRIDLTSVTAAEGRFDTTGARNLQDRMSASALLPPDFAALPPGQYVGAVEIGPGLGEYVGMYAPTKLELPHSGRAAVCIDVGGRPIMVAGRKFLPIVAIHPLDRSVDARPVRRS